MKKFRRRPTLPPSCPGSTIGAEELNFRVRDGNGCYLLAIATENLLFVFRIWCLVFLARKNTANQTEIWNAQFSFNLDTNTDPLLVRLCQLFCGQAARPISTSKLNALPHLHTWPINLVVFEGSSVSPVSRGKGYLISGLASRLDAFSGYPFRT